ncbi:OmpA family protein [Tenacibaculum sp. M341]|uniref:OmpA family protein n=1 Tax=Tenacibaculum sp. M341 TaxID=2530339 RepID=UPI0010533330|nr:OmpA family protein [Tenacibaculum sp. M341]TCI85339.1 flagellar motor protein MotB [Tenacibaculum sp. M341]
MKKITIVLFTLISILTIQAQNHNLKRANKYFERTFYAEAIPLYEKALKDGEGIDAVKNLADSYYYTNNMGKAAVNYKYLLKNYSKYVDESYYIKYANTLKALGKYKNAHNLLRNYYKKKNKEKLPSLIEEIEYLEDIQALGNRFTIENLGINTPESEFGAIRQGDTFIFSAPRKEQYGKSFGWNGQHYLDIYQTHINNIYLNDSVVTSFSKNINSKLHESNIVFTKDGKTAYFNRNNSEKGKRKTDNKKVTHIQLYKAELVDGKWQNIQPLPFNSNEYSTEHPALSVDEKTLYFASDMPNGFGSFDLYAVEIYNDGNFGEPKNLGPTINTENREQFPFVSNDNKFYFSSDGHPSFGSLDVFVSTISKNSFSKPDNVGFPVNSGYDDFSFNINPTTKEGFFASNRTGGKGSDDIYKIFEERPLKIQKCQQFISGTITDIDSGVLLPNTLVVLTDANGKVLNKHTTNDNGDFKFTVACKVTYVVKASKEGYTKEQKTVIVKKERNKNNDASMELKSLAIIAEEEQKALELKKLKEREALALQQKKEQEQKLKEQEALKVTIAKKKEKIIADEEDIEKEKGKVIVKTDEINFDYKLWYLRRDSKKAIDKVITLMKKYPDMVVEVGTHSDIRGNNRYNLELSQKRATSVRMYFLENGIEPDRITAIGYGETQPLIKCKTEDACTEEQHEINRRCEFVVKKLL